MAKNKKVLMVGTLTCLALTLSVGVASASWGDVLQKYLVKDEATLQSNMESWSNEQLIQEDDGVLAFNSLKRLSKINATEALEVSENILANLENESSDKISAALKATAKYLKNEERISTLQDNNLESDFIDLSFKIIKSSDDQILNYVKGNANKQPYSGTAITPKKQVNYLTEI